MNNKLAARTRYATMKESGFDQKQIIADQKQIIADQKQIIADQKQIIADQKQIIADQDNEIQKQRKRIIDFGDILERIMLLLLNVIELRDPYTKGHSEHVAEITVNIVRNMYPEAFDDIGNVRMAALLHDIGKKEIDETVLNKPTRLTEAEFLMIQYHTILGEKLIDPLGLDSFIAEAILSHHENYNGTGYPNGLHGQDIPFIARIIRIVDTFDALTTSRPYRDALSVKEAICVVEKNQDCFDPEILAFFKKNIKHLTRRCT